MLKKSAIMNSLWAPIPRVNKNAQKAIGDPVEIALLGPFPVDCPNPSTRYDHFDAQLATFKWELLDAFGLDDLQQFGEEEWFAKLVSLLYHSSSNSN
jgi:hypothetical protein